MELLWLHKKIISEALKLEIELEEEKCQTIGIYQSSTPNY